MDFANLTERARGILQAAQMEALAGRHQNLLPEHLLKALIEDPEGLAGHLVRDAGGDPELLRTAAEERLERLPKASGDGPHPIFMSPELAAVLQHASEAARAAGDRFVTAERLLASLAAQGPLRTLFKRAGLDPAALTEAVERMRQGRKADAMYLFTEANENVQAYGMATHRHTPEIEQELSMLAGRPVVVAFTPHLVPLNRGLFTTASVPLTKPATTAELVALYQEFYAGEPFVRVLEEGQRPTTRSVVGSNFCDVTVVADPRTKRAVCVSALDNLGKGGSANGIQNLNIMMGWDERTGLDAPPVYP